jgi:hypothetical protein
MTARLTREVRCLTLRRPWSWAVRPDGKLIENRAPSAVRWRAHVGKVLVIHAGGGWSPPGGDSPLLRGLALKISDHERLDYLRHWRNHGAAPLAHRETLFPSAQLEVLTVLTDVHEAELDAEGAVMCCESPWAEASYSHSATGATVTRPAHLELSHVHRLAMPIRAKGALGIWTPGPELLTEILDAAQHEGWNPDS